ncbi:MAG: VanZ family protein [Planctomycetes bacterium]|nr:VanZ family protein [Planctomycetota bacterium]
MNADSKPTPTSGWVNWYRRALPAYWIFLFCATHFPRLVLEGPIPQTDKVAHSAAFGLLAFLFWRFVETFRSSLGSGFVWFAAGLLIAYAAVDEYLQLFVGRSGDVRDWISDTGGIVAVLAALEWCRRKNTPVNPRQKPPTARPQ